MNLALKLAKNYMEKEEDICLIHSFYFFEITNLFSFWYMIFVLLN